MLFIGNYLVSARGKITIKYQNILQPYAVLWLWWCLKGTVENQVVFLNKGFTDNLQQKKMFCTTTIAVSRSRDVGKRVRRGNADLKIKRDWAMPMTGGCGGGIDGGVYN